MIVVESSIVMAPRSVAWGGVSVPFGVRGLVSLGLVLSQVGNLSDMEQGYDLPSPVVYAVKLPGQRRGAQYMSGFWGIGNWGLLSRQLAGI